jgi:hypothetical protein
MNDLSDACGWEKVEMKHDKSYSLILMQMSIPELLVSN